MKALFPTIAVAAFTFILGTGFGVKVRGSNSPTPCQLEADFVAAVRSECDKFESCMPLHAKWGAERAIDGKLSGRCECDDPPNVGVRPKVRRPPVVHTKPDGGS